MHEIFANLANSATKYQSSFATMIAACGPSVMGPSMTTCMPHCLFTCQATTSSLSQVQLA